jgi:hypothetical protein
MPAHTLPPQRKISSRHLGGNNSIIPPTAQIAPCDFHVFLHLKTFLGCRRFHDDNKVKEAVNTWFASQTASFYDVGIQKLVSRYDKCLNNGGNYDEKWRKLCTSNGNINGFEINIYFLIVHRNLHSGFTV